MSSSPPSYCTEYKQYRPRTKFPVNRLGRPYKTCKHCKAKRSRTRPALQELDVDAVRQTRSGSILPPSGQPPRKRTRTARYPVAAAPLLPLTVIPDPIHEQSPARLDLTDRNHELADNPDANVHPSPLPEPLLRGPTPPGFRSRFAAFPAYYLGNLRNQLYLCEFCAAYHWPAERTETGSHQYELCYKKGDIDLDPLQTPPAFLRTLYTAQDPRGRAFRKHIRAYNNALAFTSVNYTPDKRTSLRGGLQCFRIHGDLYHLQGPLLPQPGALPAFVQLFFYDPDYATDLRYQQHPDLDPLILRGLLDMLTDCNPFIGLYKTARERLLAQQGDFRLLLNPQMQLIVQTGADRRRKNLPTVTKLARIIPEEFTDGSRRDLVLTVREPGYGRPFHQVPITHATYAPLYYVLLFPRGEHG